MLGRNLDRDSAAISKIDHKILSRTALLLSKHTSTRAESKTKRAEQDAAHQRAPSNTARTNPLDIIISGLNMHSRNIASIEPLLDRARPL